MLVCLFLAIGFLNYVAGEVRYTSGGGDFCIVDGRPYRNGERIPREHVCHVCLCHLGKAECSWMRCPPPPQGCTVFAGYCNPTLYVCSIPEHLIWAPKNQEARKRDVASSPLLNSYSNKEDTTDDCNVLGVPYKTGDLMGIASSFCLECRCARKNMFCSPRCCFQYASLHENITLREQQELGPVRKLAHPLQYLLLRNL